MGAVCVSVSECRGTQTASTGSGFALDASQTSLEVNHCISLDLAGVPLTDSSRHT